MIGPYAWREGIGILAASDFSIVRIDPENPGGPEPIVETEASEWGPKISPDGRWFAYTSDQSGRYEIHARAIGGPRGDEGLNAGPMPHEGGFSAAARLLYNGQRK